MPNKEQIKLIQTAARSAGLRANGQDGRYYLVLSRYRTSKGKPVQSCKELNNWQIDDFLAICEALGWRYPGQGERYCRDRAAAAVDGLCASYAQQQAIDHLAGDLGLSSGIGRECLKQFIRRMTRGRTDDITSLTRKEAYNIIEALKAQLQRHDERTYENCKDIQTNYCTEEKHGTEPVETCQI